jgi:hypothetical protein
MAVPGLDPGINPAIFFAALKRMPATSALLSG